MIAMSMMDILRERTNNMMVKKSMRQAVCIGLMTVSLFGGSVMAAPTSNDLDAEIQAQQQKLQQLNQQKASQRDQELVNRLSDLENKLDRLKDNRPAYDAQGAVESLAAQINDLRSDVTALSDAQASYILPLTDRDFTRALWQSATECPVVFPEGVGVCPWMVPGGADIAMATSELMKTYQAAIWAQHGLFASGPDFDITFGLAHTIEKSAEIYVKVLSMGGGIIRQTITDDDLRAIARDFGVTLNEKFLN